jgi:hypothetical protein
MAREYERFEGRSCFLVRLSNKTYGIKSHKQRIEQDRERDTRQDERDVCTVTASVSYTVNSRSFTGTKISTLGEIAKF